MMKAGRIYIPLWLDLLSNRFLIVRRQFEYLHSTMVRFIISLYTRRERKTKRFTFHYGQIYYTGVLENIIAYNIFTFHYGQIYYKKLQNSMHFYRQIYIPLWLDLLFVTRDYACDRIMIYIPLWLDLLLVNITFDGDDLTYLHSTMVRFIMGVRAIIEAFKNGFTFHYGQIYYYKRSDKRQIYRLIYIPLWLDLLFKKI